MKQIEPGCMAIVYGTSIDENNGKEVIVGQYLGKIPNCAQGDLWEVDPPLLVRANAPNYTEVIKRPYCPERSLMRIDVHEETESQEAEQELVHG